MQPRVRSALLALVIMIMLVSTAYLAAGALHDRLAPEPEEPVADVRLVAVAIGGLGGEEERSPLLATLNVGGKYDIGIRVQGLRSEGGVRTMFSMECEGIDKGDVDVYYYDPGSDSWKPVAMVDGGDSLQGIVGPPNGVAVYYGYDQLYKLLIISHIDGKCTPDAWVEWG
ncbi:MAG TPA: hypothetical protein PKO24_07015 [Methanomassiliicoccales archaeon]|nr:hypothetical protein [Methanomassiliicoccales archaeon]